MIYIKEQKKVAEVNNEALIRPIC